MAIPVLFTVELFPWSELTGTSFENAISEFNDELREFFADKVGLADIARDASNVTGTDTVYGTGIEERIPFVAATVVIGFKGIDIDEALPLAEKFTTAKFNHVSAEIVNVAAA